MASRRALVQKNNVFKIYTKCRKMDAGILFFLSPMHPRWHPSKTTNRNSQPVKSP